MPVSDTTRSKEVQSEAEGWKQSCAELARAVHAMGEEMRTLFAGLRVDRLPEGRGGRSPESRSTGSASATSHFATRFPRLDFPRFSGEDLMPWIYKCDQFFEIDGTPEDAKVRMASVHLEGKALYWHQAYMKARLTRQWPNWEEYSQALHGRFGSALFGDPMSELKNLRQRTTVQNYLDEFELLLHRVSVSEDNAISLCLGGLREDIQYGVRMFRPKSLQETFSLARLQEQQLSYRNRKSTSYREEHSSYEEYKGHNPKTSGKPTGSAYARPSHTEWGEGRKSSSSKLDEKRRKGLCFWCDQQYTPGHKCPNRRQAYSMEVVVEAVGEMEEDGEEEQLEFGAEGEETQGPQVSMNALTGVTHNQTMRVTASHQGQPISVLIDSGSTHNFLDEGPANRMQCHLDPIEPFSVAVANGKTITSSHRVESFTWWMQGAEFSSDMFILPLGGCDVVLGVQWLITLGPVNWDFGNLRMEFWSQGKKVALRGATTGPGVWSKGTRVQKLIDKGGQLNMLAMCRVQDRPAMKSVEKEGELEAWKLEGEKLSATELQQLKDLLEWFAELFEEPRGLPPKRGQEHKISSKRRGRPST
ncbi:hypothetical protein KSP39_PZI006748 [Platanthera zijinensis]|uniref:Retrotransposon gag domain-containing protein n=1 Tax=Platanthera zijinensis TaxID=2320716 RepID=A0AAP0BRW8_9ASPA